MKTVAHPNPSCPSSAETPPEIDPDLSITRGSTSLLSCSNGPLRDGQSASPAGDLKDATSGCPSYSLYIEWVSSELLGVPKRKLRTHPERQILQLVANIEQFGFLVPVLVDEHLNLITGVGRLEAARRLGLKSIPVIRISHLTPAQIRAFRIADNRLAELSDWNRAELALELKELGELDLDFSLELTGFTLDEIEKLKFELVDEAAPNPDDAAPPLETASVSNAGDLWLLGPHRLLCGDATNADHTTRLLGSERPHLMVTDPPYGVDYDPAWRNRAGVSTTDRVGKVANDGRADWREAWALFPGDVLYVWHAGVQSRVVAESLEVSGFIIRSQIIWAKPRFVLGRGDYHWQHEPCFYGVRRGASSRWAGGRDQTTLWTIAPVETEDQATIHGTQKPVECMRRAILNNSHRNDAVYEPFAGSGTTIIAAERTGRRCLAMEIDPRYVDLIVRRWQLLTGQDAVHEASGLTFSELAAERETPESGAGPDRADGSDQPSRARETGAQAASTPVRSRQRAAAQ